MLLVSPKIYFPTLPSIRIVSTETTDKVTRIAKKAITQATTSIAVNMAVRTTLGAFLVPQSVVLFTAALQIGLALLAINHVWHSCYPKKTDHPATIEIVTAKAARVSLVNTATLTLNHYIHEYGHALAALASFIDAQPEVTADYRGGSTSYVVSYGLTRFGKLLGEERAKLLVAAAGPIASVAFGGAEIAISTVLGKDHPLLADLLNDHGFAQIAETMLYGVSAFTASKMDLGHDFIYLWEYGGIHPAVPLTLMALAVAAGCYATQTTACRPTRTA